MKTFLRNSIVNIKRNLLQYLVSLEYIVLMVYTGNGLKPVFFYPGLKYFSMNFKYLRSLVLMPARRNKVFQKTLNCFHTAQSCRKFVTDRLYHTSSGDPKR